MLKRTKTINKQQYKRSAGCCRICKNPKYATRHVHRIVPGAEGGKYTEDNSVPLCANCHSLVHDGSYQIDRWYPSTAGYVLRVLINGEEHFF